MNILSVIKRSSYSPDLSRGEFICTFLNPYSYLIARKTPELFARFDSVLIDGSALVFLLRLAGMKRRRVSFDMSSLAPEVFSSASENDRSLAVIGSTPQVIDRAVKIFSAGYANSLNFSFVRSGYFGSPEERQAVLVELRNQNPGLVIVGMGTPIQEKFLEDLWELGWRGQGFTCGGFLHQTAKRGIKYYPSWVDRLNLRWAYRIYDEPKLLKRYFIFYPYFLLVFAKDGISFALAKKTNA